MSEKEKNAQELLNGSPKYPERAAERSGEQPSCEGVYAGPEQMPVFAQPVQPIAMVTYAGPQFMNNGIPFQQLGAFAPAPQQPVQPTAQQEASPDKVQCSGCGSFASKGSKFCAECGRQLDTSDGGNKV